jgi:low molecular weight protein-tyrosine phosphatase
MNHQILFVCTGNYYRSRFTEILFNALAAKYGLPWRAISRGIATGLGVGNVGPISPLVLKELASLGIQTEASRRMPIQLRRSDLEESDLVVALDAAEHAPLIKRRFAQWADWIEYWNVPDLGLMSSEEAFSQIEKNVTALVQQLQATLDL